ncbi:MAG: hypothetical protein RBG13Loki_0963 [Promethearchaeota archaeon CR_4]|nr:MAG: hypothetical protein RBG13Loki_0963 [Candidatus Lokiarchaeota archaeon CR_4]
MQLRPLVKVGQRRFLLRQDDTIRIEGKTIANIGQIHGLGEIEHLKGLSLAHNHIEKIEGLDGLVHLEWLDLSDNLISFIEGLEHLENLKTLSLSNNQIEVIEGLDRLNTLQELDLSNNHISKIEGLEKLPLLKFLFLRNNKIEKIEGLGAIIDPVTINLDNNPIEEWPVEKTASKLVSISRLQDELMKKQHEIDIINLMLKFRRPGMNQESVMKDIQASQGGWDWSKIANEMEKARMQYLETDNPAIKIQAKKRLQELRQISKTLVF